MISSLLLLITSSTVCLAVHLLPALPQLHWYVSYKRVTIRTTNRVWRLKMEVIDKLTEAEVYRIYVTTTGSTSIPEHVCRIDLSHWSVQYEQPGSL